MTSSKRFLAFLISLMLVLLVSLTGCSSSSHANDARSNSATNKQQTYSPPSKTDQKIAWIDSLGNNAYNVMMHASYGEGSTCWVYGYAYNVHYAPESNGQPTFIDMSEKGYESRQLTAIVWGENLGNFNMDLSSLQGKYIAVYGTVYRYKGYFMQMELTDESQIRVCPVSP